MNFETRMTNDEALVRASSFGFHSGIRVSSFGFLLDPVPKDHLRQPLSAAFLDVIRHVLSGGDVRQTLVHLPHDVQHDADVRGFVELSEDDLVDAYCTE